MLRNKTARQHNFATVPRADIPRSKFRMRQTRKMAFDASELIPIMCEEILPGDTWQHHENIMARFATPIAPAVDDIDLETFYFFVPNRFWPKWEKLITGTDDTLTTPQIGANAPSDADYQIPVGSVWDHFGLPPMNIATNTGTTVNAFPFLAYLEIYNQWFRDQNLQSEWLWDKELNAWDLYFDEAGLPSGGATNTFTHLVNGNPVNWDGMPLRANKRHDYFTSSLPWPQKGDAVQLPLGTTAPVIANPDTTKLPLFTATGVAWPGPAVQSGIAGTASQSTMQWAGGNIGNTTTEIRWGTETGLITDLSEATAATINAIRLAFQTQKLLERDARGGSRYVEQILSHFGVRSPDYRLQRPEYLGGSKIPVNVNPIAQTAAYDAEPADAASALGNLGAEMHARGSKRTFTYAATEHGYIIGLAVVRATPSYQQGIRRHWLHNSRLSYYFPAFAMLGEQAVQTREIYWPGTTELNNETWGYQERWAELRYTPNEITGVLRSTAPQPLDWWHYSEEFANEPALNEEFITDKTQETLARSLATAPSAQWSAQIIMDILHENTVARLLPTYSVPGLIDHF